MESTYSFGSWGPTSEEILKNRFPLHHSCRNGDIETLSTLLLKAQHSILEEDNFYGWTAAHWAAYFGKLTCLMRLLDISMSSGCNASDISTQQLRQTPAHIAAFAGHSHCLKWLLHCGASLDRQLACVRKLITTTRVGVDSNILTSRFRQTPAHLAAFGGHPQCLLWLLQSGANIDQQDYLGETAVHKAGRAGSIECVSLLTSHGARILIKNNNGYTAAEVAKMCGYVQCALYLDNTASLQPDKTGLTGSNSSSPVHKVTQPSPLDVTSRKRVFDYHDLPGMDDCQMDAACTPSLANQSHLDITLNASIAANQIAVGGHKRAWDNTEEPDFKRIRHTGYGLDEVESHVTPPSNGFWSHNADSDDMMETCGGDDLTHQAAAASADQHLTQEAAMMNTQSTMTPPTMTSIDPKDLIPNPEGYSQMFGVSPAKCDNRLPIDAAGAAVFGGVFPDSRSTNCMHANNKNLTTVEHNDPHLQNYENTSSMEHGNSVQHEKQYDTVLMQSVNQYSI